MSESSLPRWKKKAIRLVPKEKRKKKNSLVTLTAWEIKKNRNSCVFENARKKKPDLLRKIANE
ncbi:hypothetical protein BAE44_0016749 [Dichanthelium oligosanthes]|uniref:Uncharacterized protein n=1 Tax=Dichanthelium oligosanthes TaxID=888268 RepID=A0A1E5VAQ1_9POAL|nr:hypothetical protein BAE44_0016749 [Dichanthelium oligosanthes]